MEKSPSKILFVYNAHSGLGAKTFDFLHKIVSPATYQCSLCAITYGDFKMKKEWKLFLEQLPYEVAFWYKNDFLQSFPAAHKFPCVYLSTGNSLQLLVSADEMDGIDLKTLKDILQKRISGN